MRSSLPLLLALALAAPTSAHAQYLLELTFDDEAEGTGPSTGHERVMNLEPPPAGLSAVLAGDARRSALDAGRYGRGVDLSGAGFVAVPSWPAPPRMLAYTYLLPRSTVGGEVVSHGDALRVSFRDGALVAGARPAGGTEEERPLGLPWPDDGQFHHLAVRVERSGSQTEVFASVDFEDEVSVIFAYDPAPSDEPLRFGRGFDGVLDELIVTARDVATRSREMDRFNRLAGECIDGLACAEEVFMTRIPDLAHEVPVRIKMLYDPALCNAESPCSLVIEISGGGMCNNDYGTPEEIRELAALGFVVATVDPYCETGRIQGFVINDEIDEIIAAKDYVMSRGRFTDRILGPDYMASGCSHGADAVSIWAVTRDDHPARTFVRSSSGAGLCPQVAGQICGLELPPGIDMESPMFRQAHEFGDIVGRVTPEIAASREIARSWGRNLDGPVCNDDGSIACSEEGKHAMTYASRRFRHVWEAQQPASAPTGYFVEDTSSDCQHCAPFDSEAFRCGACLLRHGRVGMESACPACLGYEDPSIDHGEPAGLCPIEASWYDDPVTALSTPRDAGPGTAADGGMGMGRTDAGPPSTMDPTTDCSCRAAGAGSSGSAGWAALLFMAGLARLRWRFQRGSRRA